MRSFGKLVRFKAPSGSIHYGEVRELADISAETLVRKRVPVFEGDVPWSDDFKLSGKTETIVEVLCPLASVPIFLCVGINYRTHTTESKISQPEHPVIFMKQPAALAGPFEAIPIHKECLEMDYEAELCVVVGRDCKNLSAKDDPLDYICGYTAGNDVSSRYWYWAERSAHQACYSKSFDKFAPLGPVISSPDIIPDPHVLSIKAIVNGEVRQSANTADLIFNIPTIMRHLTRGTTLKAGTVIMTGTPSGVAAYRTPPPWLKNGDIVEVEIEQIGRMRNRMEFQP